MGKQADFVNQEWKRVYTELLHRFDDYQRKTEKRFGELGAQHANDLRERDIAANNLQLRLASSEDYRRYATDRIERLNADVSKLVTVQSERTAARRLLREALGYKDADRGVSVAMPIDYSFEEVVEPDLVGLVEEIIALAQRGPAPLIDALNAHNPILDDMVWTEGAPPRWGKTDRWFDEASMIPRSWVADFSRTRAREERRQELIDRGLDTVRAIVAHCVDEASWSKLSPSVWLRDVYGMIHAVGIGHAGDSAEVRSELLSHGFVWWPFVTATTGRRFIHRDHLTPGDWARIVEWFLETHAEPHCDDCSSLVVDAACAATCFGAMYGHDTITETAGGHKCLWSIGIASQKQWQFFEEPRTWVKHPTLD